MFELIWIAIIIIWVVYKVKASKKSQEQNGTGQPTTSQSATVPKPSLQSRVAGSTSRQRTVPNVSNTATLPTHMDKRMESLAERVQGQTPKMTKSGEHMIASRLMEGDPTPNGYRKYVCTYCGAENLTPANARDKYKCYFCHTDL